MSNVTLQDLTQGTINGTGVFDKLMAACKDHLEDQFRTGALKGTEYAQVYLGGMQQAMQTALQFLATNQKIGLEVQLLEKQLEQAEAQRLQIEAQTRLVEQQILASKTDQELADANKAHVEAQTLNVAKQGLQIEAQTALINQQKLNTAEELKSVTAQIALVTSNKAKVDAETLLVPKQGLQMDAQTALLDQQKTNAVAEKLQIEAQTSLIGSNKAKTDAEALNIPKQGLQIEAQTSLITQQKENAVQEKLNLVAQECLLKAQFDNTEQNTDKAAAETDLLKQKIVTEKAQTMELGVDENSVIGRQKQLYGKQAAGFDRDAELKAFNAWASTWNARRMTDEGTVADPTNKLDDVTGGRLMAKVLSGVGA